MKFFQARAGFAVWLIFSTSGCWIIAGVNDGQEIAPSTSGSSSATSATGTGGASASSASGSTTSTSDSGSASTSSSSTAAGGAGGSATTTTGAGGVAPMMGPLLPDGDSDESGYITENMQYTFLYQHVDDPIGSPDDNATYVETFLVNGADCYYTTLYPPLAGTFNGLTVHLIATAKNQTACTSYVEIYTPASTGPLVKGIYPTSWGTDGMWQDRPISVQFPSGPETDATFKVKLHTKNTTNAGACAYTQIYIEGIP